MSGFVSSPPATEVDPEAPETDLVAGDDFYPAVSIAQARDALRLPHQATDIRVRDALRAGMLTARRELRAWKAAAVAAGAASMADVLDEQVDGQSALELLYTRAVHAFAAAELAETHNDISASGDGKDRASENALSADDHRRNGIHAIRDILGTNRTMVELI